MKFIYNIVNNNLKILLFYRAFHGFGQAKFAFHGGLILDSSKFTLLPQLPLKITLDLKVVKLTRELCKDMILPIKCFYSKNRTDHGVIQPLLNATWK